MAEAPARAATDAEVRGVAALDVSVVIPTYNEAEALPAIVPEISRALADAGLSHEIIVVDDASPDRTREVAASLGASYPLRVIVRQGERSLARAVLDGISASSATVVAVMDADGSHPVHALGSLVGPILRGDADMALGSRYMPGGEIHGWSRGRRFISRFASLLTSGLTSLSDPTTGLMAVRRALVEGIAFRPVGWKIVLEMAVKLEGFRLIEVPITFVDRKLGKSKLEWTVYRDFLRHLWRLHGYKRLRARTRTLSSRSGRDRTG